MFKGWSQDSVKERNNSKLVELSDSKPSVSERLIWKQSELFRDCSENYRNLICSGRTDQIIVGPIGRQEVHREFPPSFLPNMLANIASNSLRESDVLPVSDYCRVEDLLSLHSWSEKSREINSLEYMYINYLSPDQPWFFCFSRDRHAQAVDLRSSGEFQLAHYEFWIWRQGRLIYFWSL